MKEWYGPVLVLYGIRMICSILLSGDPFVGDPSVRWPIRGCIQISVGIRVIIAFGSDTFGSHTLGDDALPPITSCCLSSTMDRFTTYCYIGNDMLQQVALEHTCRLLYVHGIEVIVLVVEDPERWPVRPVIRPSGDPSIRWRYMNSLYRTMMMILIIIGHLNKQHSCRWFCWRINEVVTGWTW